MTYKVIVDSCGELTPQMKQSGIFHSVALRMELSGESILDDETFDQADFLRKAASATDCPKSSCPSPDSYREGFSGEEERAYGVTLSDKLSGSYNSALLGRTLALEDAPDKKIHVFNSFSASVGETLIALKIQECEEKAMAFEKVVENVERYISSQHTYFVLENLDTLRKNGRLSGIRSVMAGALNIKPIMGSTPDGQICERGQARGVKKALEKMVECLVKETENAQEKILGIAHCNCRERAEEVERMIRKRIRVKASFLIDTAGISSMYANEGGIIVVI